MKRVLLVSDMQIGSRLSICPPEVHLDEEYPPSKGSRGDDEGGAVYKANKVQRAFYDIWEEEAHKWRGKLDAIVLNGDIPDGQGPYTRRVEQWTTQPEQQVDTAIDLISMWDAPKTYVLRGSCYHVTVNGIPMEEHLAQKLHAERYPGIDPMGCRAARSGFEWYLRLEDVVIHFAHHMGVSTVWHYRSTPPTREMMFAKLNDRLVREWERAQKEGRKHKFYRTDAIVRSHVRSHVHYYWLVDSSSTTGVVLPCWQAKTSYMLKKSPLGMIPDIGYVLLEVDGSEMRFTKRLWSFDKISPVPMSIV